MLPAVRLQGVEVNRGESEAVLAVRYPGAQVRDDVAANGVVEMAPYAFPDQQVGGLELSQRAGDGLAEVGEDVGKLFLRTSEPLVVDDDAHHDQDGALTVDAGLINIGEVHRDSVLPAEPGSTSNTPVRPTTFWAPSPAQQARAPAAPRTLLAGTSLRGVQRLQEVLRRSRGRALLVERRRQRASAKTDTSDRGWWLWPLAVGFALFGGGSGIKQTLEMGRPIGVLPAVLWMLAVAYIAWPLRYSWRRHRRAASRG